MGQRRKRKEKRIVARKKEDKKKTTKELKSWRKIKRNYPFLKRRYFFPISKKEEKKDPPSLIYDIPRGWLERFGEELCEELKADFIQHGCLETACISEAKEKYGDLRLTVDGVPDSSRCEDIIQKYAIISAHTCIICGKMDVPMVNIGGWFSPICEDCYQNFGQANIPYSQAACGKKKIPEQIGILRGPNMAETVDISETIQKLKKGERKCLEFYI